MKIVRNVCLFLLCSVLAEGFSTRFLKHNQAPEVPTKKEEGGAEKKVPAEGQKETQKKKETEGEKPATKEAEAEPMSSSAHKDNFQDELVDQADPEFDMVSGGDACISWDDAKKPLLEQFQEGAPDVSALTDAEKKEVDAIQKDMLSDVKMQYDHADANKDGCIDKKEFKAVGEMEGPPPGFSKAKMEEDDMNSEEFDEAMEEEEKYEFDAMDRSGNEKISKPEAYHYANDNMPQADMSAEDLDEMFDDTDTNKDGDITFDEFSHAGEAVDGDGNEMKKVPPMGFKIFRSRKHSLLVKVKKGLLAQKPPLRIVAKLL